MHIPSTQSTYLPTLGKHYFCATQPVGLSGCCAFLTRFSLSLVLGLRTGGLDQPSPPGRLPRPSADGGRGREDGLHDVSGIRLCTQWWFKWCDVWTFWSDIDIIASQKKATLKGFATFWEFSFYGQKKVADYEYHSLFAEKIHFHT